MSIAEDNLREALGDSKTSVEEERTAAFLRVMECLYGLTDAELLVWGARFYQKQGKDVLDEFASGALLELAKKRGVIGQLKKMLQLTPNSPVPSNYVVVGGTRIDFTICDNLEMHLRDKLCVPFKSEYIVKYKIAHQKNESLDIKLREFRLTGLLGAGYALFGFTFELTPDHRNVYRQLGMACKKEKKLKDLSENSIETGVATWEKILAEVSGHVNADLGSCLLLREVFVEKTLQKKLGFEVHGDIPKVVSKASRE